MAEPAHATQAATSIDDLLANGGAAFLLEAGVCTRWEVGERQRTSEGYFKGELQLTLGQKLWWFGFVYSRDGPWLDVYGPSWWDFDRLVAATGYCLLSDFVVTKEDAIKGSPDPEFGIFLTVEQCEGHAVRFKDRRCSSPTLARELDYFVNGGEPPAPGEYEGGQEEEDTW